MTPCSQCRGPGLITGQRTDLAHMPQLKILHAATKDPAAVKIVPATTKTWHSQRKK